MIPRHNKSTLPGNPKTKHQKMESELPTKTSLESQAASGRPITQAEATAIAHAESDMTRRGPIKGGTAATAQRLHDRQQNFFEVAGEVARKPSGEVTKDDAARVQRFEVSPLDYRLKLFLLLCGTGDTARPGSKWERGIGGYCADDTYLVSGVGTRPWERLAIGRGAESCRA